MPCGDITERISVRLDFDDRLVSYQLNKRTCGTAIGSESLLLPWLLSWSATDILAATPDAMQRGFADIAEDMEFIYAKHLLALQEALRALCGLPTEAAAPLCTPVTISAEADAVCFEGLLQAEDIHARVRSCGSCGGCGGKAKRSKDLTPTPT